MTKKYFLHTINGDVEVKVGETCTTDIFVCGLDAKLTMNYSKENIKHLMKEGVVVMKKYAPKATAKPLTPQYVVQLYANMANVSYNYASEYLENLYSVCPQACISAMLYAVAKHMDKKYSDHIENSKKLYCISLNELKVVELPRLMSFKYIAVFRTETEAYTAWSCVKSLLTVFDEGEQKD